MLFLITTQMTCFYSSKSIATHMPIRWWQILNIRWSCKSWRYLSTLQLNRRVLSRSALSQMHQERSGFPHNRLVREQNRKNCALKKKPVRVETGTSWASTSLTCTPPSKANTPAWAECCHAQKASQLPQTCPSPCSSARPPHQGSSRFSSPKVQRSKTPTESKTHIKNWLLKPRTIEFNFYYNFKS